MVRRSVGEYQCPVLMVVPSNGHNAGRPAAAATKKPESGGKKLRFQLAKERKASTTLGIIMSAFTVCWLPFFVLALVRPFLSDPSSIPSSLSSLFLWLGYANSLLNPVSAINSYYLGITNCAIPPPPPFLFLFLFTSNII
jgi:ABC-type multidrug transport system fused ATPase/permease subunit